ncbi:aspartate/glutamate racemase family protein, partial [Methylobacterium sp. WL103]|uniref:aspartate/glutamate racemase family protein n=1 Tax=Methylobacterium sp. WL103 TaxID=2603891 RepID=UPI001FF03F99
EIHRDPDAALADLVAACRACAEADGAQTVILGGAGLAGLAERIRPDVPVPVLCSVEAGTHAVLAAAALPRPTPSRHPLTDATGLSPALARLLAGP